MITLEVEGVEYTDFESASARTSMVDFSGSFSFTAVTKDNKSLPLKGNESCRVIVDGTPVITGYIERVDIDYDEGGHTITYSGRDITADLGDSTLDSISDLKAPISLVSAIQLVIDSIEGSGIKVIDNVGDLKDFAEAADLISPSIGQNAFDFMEKLARKRQVLLSTDGLGNVVITKTTTVLYPKGLQNVVGSSENNILSASASYDLTNIFNKYIIKAQLNPSAINIAGLTAPSEVVDQKGVFIDSEARIGRQIIIKAEQSSSNDDSFNRAEWESSIRRSKSIQYSVKALGHSNDGEVWKSNKLISVVDEFANIDDIMLIESVDYQSSEGGNLVDLILVQKDSFILDSKKPVKKKKGGLGAEFIKSFT